MQINGKTATKNEELKVWEEQLKEARKSHNIPLIIYAKEKVDTLKPQARSERIMNKLKQ